jgi:hypothetical protein
VEESFDKYGDRPGQKLFSARFRYEYIIDGKRYEGTQYSLVKEWSSSDREPHDKEVVQFPEGREVTIRVNPMDPTEAVLQADPAFFPVLTVPIFLVTLLGLGLLGAALVLGLIHPT